MDVIAASRILLADGLDGPGWVQIDDEGRIAAAGLGVPPTPASVTLPHGVLAPGLVDIQLNGAFGHDLADAEADGWTSVVQRLPAFGVTAFVPTFITATTEDLAASLRRYRDLRPRLDAADGARTVGAHCEGPFLAASRRGAHRADLLVDPTPERVDALVAAGDGALTYVTLAPEREGAIAAISRFVDCGVRVAVGHSDATDAQVHAAVEAGARLVTHLFNAQSPLHHRAPGVVGAGLSDPRITAGLIADLHHVAPTAVRVAFAAASGRIALVSDAISALGMPPGTHVLGGETTEVLADQPPRRADGTLAGSVLRLDDAIANVIGCGIDPEAALVAATRVPADAIGRDDLGRIRPGALADLVWLDDGWRAAATWVAGRCVHTAAQATLGGDLPVQEDRE